MGLVPIFRFQVAVIEQPGMTIRWPEDVETGQGKEMAANDPHILGWILAERSSPNAWEIDPKNKALSRPMLKNLKALAEELVAPASHCQG